MKILLLIACLGIGYFPANGQATVIIQYPLSEAGKTRSYIVPLSDGRFLNWNQLKLKVDNKGKTTIKLSLKKPGVIYAGNVHIWVEPKASILIDLRDHAKVSGSLANENAMMMAWKKDGFFSWSLSSAGRPPAMQAMDRLVAPTAVLRMRDSLITVDNELFDKLLDSTDLSTEFVTFMRREIATYFNEITFMSIFFRLGSYASSSVPADSTVILSDWGLALTEVAGRLDEDISFNQNSAETFYAMTDLVVKYHVNFLKENSIVTDSQTFEGFLADMFASAVPKAINNRLKEKDQEFFIPNYLSFYITGNTTFYTTDMLEMYNAFREKFPKSLYIEPMLPKIAEVKEVADMKVTKNPQIKVIKNFESINTYDALMSSYKGKVVLIDIWAMWCGPCIEEFKSIGQLQDLKKEQKDFEILYISRDFMSQRQRWEQFIVQKNLVGEHIIPNETLLGDLRNKIGWEAIPRYAIVNRNGEFVNIDAPAPSSGKIMDLIKEELNKSR